MTAEKNSHCLSLETNSYAFLVEKFTNVALPLREMLGTQTDKEHGFTIWLTAQQTTLI
jgi:hypothetical protein